MTRRSPRPTALRLPTAVIWAGLLVLALIAGGLSAAAVLQDRAAQQAGAAAAAKVTKAPTEQQESPTAPDAPPEEADPVAPVPLTPQRILVAGIDPGHLIRATTGACPASPGAIEVSFDNGDTWDAAPTPGDSPSQILQLDADDPVLTRMVSLDAKNCEPQAFRSFVGGTTWEPTDLADAPWYVSPADRQTVQTPAGPIALPCAAIELSASDERAIVLCDDSTVTVSSDAGSTWSKPLTVPHAVAVGLAPSQFIFATKESPDCPAVQLGIFSESGVGQVSSCLDVPAVPGQVAIAATDDLVVAWVGDGISRSFDDGVTWE